MNAVFKRNQHERWLNSLKHMNTPDSTHKGWLDWLKHTNIIHLTVPAKDDWTGWSTRILYTWQYPQRMTELAEAHEHTLQHHPLTQTSDSKASVFDRNSQIILPENCSRKCSFHLLMEKLCLLTTTANTKRCSGKRQMDVVHGQSGGGGGGSGVRGQWERGS